MSSAGPICRAITYEAVFTICPDEHPPRAAGAMGLLMAPGFIAGLGGIPIIRIRALLAAVEFGCVRPGTLAGAAATQTPAARKPTANILVRYPPFGRTFWAKISAAT